MKTKLILLTSCHLMVAIPAAYAQKEEKPEGTIEVFGGENISIPKAYVFELSVVMDLTTSEPKKKKSSMKYQMRYQMDNTALAMIPVEIDGEKPKEDITVVVDFGMKRMINFMDTEYSKMGMIYPLQDAKLISKSNLNTSNTSFTKTGKTKELFDFTCEQYAFESPEMSGNLWIASDLEINLSKSFEALGLQIQMGNLGSQDQPRGFIMEFETTAKDGVNSKMKVVDLNLNDYYKLSTDDYLFTLMPVVDEEEMNQKINSETYPEDSQLNKKAIQEAK